MALEKFKLIIRKMKTENYDHLVTLIQKHYCVVDDDGNISTRKIQSCLDGISEKYEKSGRLDPEDLPKIPGIPKLLLKIENFEQLKESMPRICKMIHAREEFILASFNNPLKLAVDSFGISFTPQMAKAIRRLLKRALPFNDTKITQRSGSGIVTMKWVPANDRSFLK